jgi:ubiquinone/menaquinone biosynthesis C-methylase UbiE
MEAAWITHWVMPVGLLVTMFAGGCGRAPAPHAATPSPAAPSHPPQGGAPPPTPRQDHAPEAHDAGRAGYHMDFSHTHHFAAHFDDASRDAWQKPHEVLKLLSLSPGARVVDLGAGTGYFLQSLGTAVGEKGRVLAVDAERKMIEHVKKRAAEKRWRNVEARLVPANDPQLEANGWDRILIVNTWHHIDDRAAYTQKLARALVPGGVLLIVDFTPESDIGPPLHHRLTADEVVGELEAGGLSARIENESLPKQYAVSGTRAR